MAGARAFVDLRPTCSSAAAWRSWTPAGCLRVLAVGSRSSVAMTSGSWRGACAPSRVVVSSRRVAGRPHTFKKLQQSPSECPRRTEMHGIVHSGEVCCQCLEGFDGLHAGRQATGRLWRHHRTRCLCGTQTHLPLARAKLPRAHASRSACPAGAPDCAAW